MPYSKLIDEYAAGGQKLAKSLEGLNREELIAFPVPGMWSIQQVVLHLMDSDLILADRMKRIIAEDNPTLIAFDQDKFAKNLFYQEQPAQQAVLIFDLNRRVFADVLRRLPPAAFDRFGTHNERGRVTLAQLLEGAVKHLEHHLKFVYEKREKLTKPIENR